MIFLDKFFRLLQNLIFYSKEEDATDRFFNNNFNFNFQ